DEQLGGDPEVPAHDRERVFEAVGRRARPGGRPRPRRDETNGSLVPGPPLHANPKLRAISRGPGLGRRSRRGSGARGDKNPTGAPWLYVAGYSCPEMPNAPVVDQGVR